MKVLVIGDGARENAYADSLASSSRSFRVCALSSYINPGIRRYVDKTGGVYLTGDINSREEVKLALSQTSPDFVVVGPEDPQFNGAVDVVREEGIPVLGATSRHAIIEKSKVWARNLMWKYSIPGRLRFRSFESMEEAAEFVSEYGASVAVKPAEQVGGKGVKVIADLQAYLTNEKREALRKGMNEIGSFVKEGTRIIIEERVFGPEYTLHVLTDGKTTIPLPLAQDYKHAFVDGIGPETGGMGSISGPSTGLPFITDEEYHRTYDIVKQTIASIEKEVGLPYTGILAGQMMLTPLWGPTVIEYYSRMGDPETSAIFPKITSDLGEILEMAATSHLSKAKLEIDERQSVVWVISPRGYPRDRQLASNHEVIVDLTSIESLGCKAYFGSVSLTGSKLITKGSRTVEITCMGSYEEAVKKLSRAVSFVSSPTTKLFYRPDVGTGIQREIESAETIRYSYKLRERKGELGVSVNWSSKLGDF